MARKFDWFLLAGLAGFTLLCQFYLLVAHPLVNYSGDAKNQVELTKPFNLLDENGLLTTKGWARQPYATFNPKGIKRISLLPYLSPIHRYRIKEWDSYLLWNEDFSFSVSVTDYGYIAKVAVNLVDFKTRKYISNGFTVPTAEVQLPTNLTREGTHIELANSKYGVKLNIYVSADGTRSVKVTTSEITAEFTLEPESNQESLALVTPIGGPNFYYNVKMYNALANGFLSVGGEEIPFQGKDTYSLFEWSRGVYDYNSDWAQLGATMMLDATRRLSINFGRGLGDQSFATENAIIINEKIYKLGHLDITYDDNNLMNPWLITSAEGLRIVFAPFVDYQTESSKTFLFLSTRTQRIFGKLLGTLVLETGEEVELQQYDVTAFAEVHYHKW